MKTSQIEKLDLELEAEESRLRRDLLRVLPEAARNGLNVFTNSAFNPSNLRPQLFRSDTEGLLQSARECIRLRAAIGVDATGSVGSLFLAACAENASKNEQRLGPRRLAASLLHALSHDT
jgi:hypothetical protein